MTKGGTHQAYLALGANLGDRHKNIREALRRLAERVEIRAVSSFYESAPSGYADQPDFLNAVCLVGTTLSPQDLLAYCKGIESAMGRTASFRNAPRPIDIDILLFDEFIIDTPELSIPHPRMTERAFVLVPLAEIAPSATHPTLGKTAKVLAQSVDGASARKVANPPEFPGIHAEGLGTNVVRHVGPSSRVNAGGRTSSKQRWLEATVTVAPELVEPLAELFAKRGKAKVAIEERLDDSEDSFARTQGPASWASPGKASAVTLRAYLPTGIAGRRSLARIEIGWALLSLITPLPPLETREVAAEEWESVLRRHFTTIHIGRRLVVRPIWQEYTPKPREVVLVLDPGAAFGTGHHPTTRLCLEFLEEYVRPGARVLDIGTGSGILAIAAAQLGAGAVLGVDTDPFSIRMARQNVRANRLQRRVRLLKGSVPLTEPWLADLVVANITAAILHRIMPALRDALAPGGVVIMSGILETQAPALLADAEATGLNVVEQRGDSDWLSFVLNRREAVLG